MIHKYYLDGFYILMDVHSGAVHLLDELSFLLADYLSPQMPPECPGNALDALGGRYGRQAVKEAYAELYGLFLAGELYAPDEYRPFADRLVAAPLKSICLNIAHDCNLRCEYCFAAKGDFGKSRSLMPFSVAKSAIDFLVANSEGRKNLEADFFGGEPLMNFDVVRQTVAYARSLEKEHGKNFRFTITTNGLLLTPENTEFINKEMSNVVLSIDGRKRVNDKLRRTKSGGGCYDLIVDKYKALVEGRNYDNYYVRGTFTRENLDFTDDVLHLNALGFDQISVEPVVSDPNLPFSVTENDLPQIFREYERLAAEIIARKKRGDDFNFFHFMLDLAGGPCAIKRLRGCSCGNEYICVTPDGNIYPCHQFVGVDGFIMGNILTGSFDQNMKETFTKTNIYCKPECSECWAKFYCSGGCNANNFQYRGNLLSPHRLSCELEKKRVECAVMIYAALAECSY